MDRYEGLIIMNTSYFEQLWGYADDLDTPYSIDNIAKSSSENIIEEIYGMIKDLTDGKSLENFIIKFYDNKLSGFPFKKYQQIARNIYNNPLNRESILQSKKICDSIINCLKEQTLDNFKILASHKIYRGDGKEGAEKFIQDHCKKLDMISARNQQELLANKCSYLIGDYRQILSQIGIHLSGSKEIDGVVRIDNTIIITEAKKQNEGGGGQKLGKDDGKNIFGASNKSKFTLLKVFCLDGISINYNEKEDEKVMTIFDFIKLVEKKIRV